MYLINQKRFILNNIEGLLKADLHPANIEASIQQQTFHVLAVLLESSAEAAIATLQDFRYKLPAVDFRQLCQQNFSDLFRLKDSTERLQKQPAVQLLNVEARELYTLLSAAFCRVQVYLESTGIRGMDADELLPPDYLAGRMDRLRGQMLLLSAKCKGRDLDPVLSALLNNHFQQFIGRTAVKQRELDFSEALLAGLLHLLVNSADDELNRAMLYGLISMNFNAGEVIAYCKSYIAKRLEGDIGNKLRMLRLSWLHKEFTQLLRKPDMVFQPGYPNLRELLLEHLSAERVHVEMLIADEAVLPVASIPVKAQQAKAEELQKLAINGSMRELSLFVQLLMQRKVIVLGTGGIKALSIFLSANISTRGSETLSAESLNKRYREAQPACCATVLSILEDMILILKRDFMRKPL